MREIEHGFGEKLFIETSMDAMLRDEKAKTVNIHQLRLEGRLEGTGMINVYK